MASPPYIVQQGAALKILLHAAKFPSAAVNGVLLGTVSAPQGDSAADAPSSGAVTVVDAIPLFHSFLALAPMLETALVQVRADHTLSLLCGWLFLKPVRPSCTLLLPRLLLRLG